MVGVIDYAMGNIQSVVNAFEYIGEQVKVITSPKELKAVDRIVLPGVGAFGVGMKNLRTLGLIEALKEEVYEKRKPFLGICLGMQLICRESYEFGYFEGLGWIDARVVRFNKGTKLRIPHIGWNNILIKRPNKIIESKFNNVDVYFMHSYYVDAPDSEVVVATCEYSQEFIVSLEQDNIFATQFHPEKSQQAGLTIFKKFATGDF